MKNPRTDPVRSLHRACALLRLLSMRPATGWRLSDLAQASDLHHATVHRLLAALVEERLAMRVAGSLRYALGPAAHELGLAARPAFDPPAAVQERLASLAAQSRDIVFLSMRSGDESVCVGRWDGRRAPKAYTVDVGTRRALAVSAGGVAILAALPPGERRSILQRNLADIGRRNEARAGAVRRMVARSVRLGYGLNDEDIIPGIAAIGVAFGPDHAPLGAVSLAAAVQDLPPARQARMLQQLRLEALRVGEDLRDSRYAASAAPFPTAPPTSPAAGRRAT